jgi:hypothetical protein
MRAGGFDRATDIHGAFVLVVAVTVLVATAVDILQRIDTTGLGIAEVSRAFRAIIARRARRKTLQESTFERFASCIERTNLAIIARRTHRSVHRSTPSLVAGPRSAGIRRRQNCHTIGQAGAWNTGDTLTTWRGKIPPAVYVRQTIAPILFRTG